MQNAHQAQPEETTVDPQLVIQPRLLNTKEFFIQKLRVPSPCPQQWIRWYRIAPCLSHAPSKLLQKLTLSWPEAHQGKKEKEKDQVSKTCRFVC